MSNENRTPRSIPQPGFLGMAIGLCLAVCVAYVSSRACSVDGGCLVGARELWQSQLPNWIQRASRGLAEFLLSPWLWSLIIVGGVTEYFRPTRESRKLFRTGATYDLLAWFLMDKLTLGLLIGVTLSYPAFVDLYERHLSFLTVSSLNELPDTARIVLAFVVADFLNWLHHLLRHKVPAFWVFHAIHHSQSEMNVFTDDRVHPIDRVIAMPIIMIPMLILDIDPPLAPWLLAAQMFYTHLYHGPIHSDFGPLRYVLVTPQSHRIHHSRETAHRDKNFGVILCLWDRIFGTHVDAWDQYPQTGVPDPGFPMETAPATAFGVVETYLKQFVYPFRQIWSRITTDRWDLPLLR